MKMQTKMTIATALLYALLGACGWVADRYSGSRTHSERGYR